MNMVWVFGTRNPNHENYNNKIVSTEEVRVRERERLLPNDHVYESTRGQGGF